MFWIYDMSSLLLALLIVAVAVFLAVAGLLVARRFVVRPLGFSRETNDTVNTFSFGITALYSVTVGLIAVASWQNYSSVAVLVSKEASTVGVLYRDVAGYPEPLRTELRRTLREYTTVLVEQVWPAQQEGRLLDAPTATLTTLHTQLLSYEPPSSGATIMHTRTMQKFDDLVDLRRQRVDRVGAGLPDVLWVVVGIGAFVTVAVRWFLWVDVLRVHILLLSLLTTFVALLIFLIAALDRPFRGRTSVPADAYRLIIERVMNPLDAAGRGAPES